MATTPQDQPTTSSAGGKGGNNGVSPTPENVDYAQLASSTAQHSPSTVKCVRMQERDGIVKSGTVTVYFQTTRSKKVFYAILTERTLEYHESEKSQHKKKHAKYIVDLSTCFNISQQNFPKFRFCVSLMTPDETMLFKSDSDRETSEWFELGISVVTPARALHLGRPVFANEFFECAWDVVLNANPKLRKPVHNPENFPNICVKKPQLATGKHRLCFYPHTIILCRFGVEPAESGLPKSGIPPFRTTDFIEFPRQYVANFGFQEKFFFMRIGRSSPTGACEVWIQSAPTVCDSEEIAMNIHAKLNDIIDRETEKKRKGLAALAAIGPLKMGGGGADAPCTSSATQSTLSSSSSMMSCGYSTAREQPFSSSASTSFTHNRRRNSALSVSATSHSARSPPAKKSPVAGTIAEDEPSSSMGLRSTGVSRSDECGKSTTMSQSDKEKRLILRQFKAKIDSMEERNTALHNMFNLAQQSPAGFGSIEMSIAADIARCSRRQTGDRCGPHRQGTISESETTSGYNNEAGTAGSCADWCKYHCQPAGHCWPPHSPLASFIGSGPAEEETEDSGGTLRLNYETSSRFSNPLNMLIAGGPIKTVMSRSKPLLVLNNRSASRSASIHDDDADEVDEENDDATTCSCGGESDVDKGDEMSPSHQRRHHHHHHLVKAFVECHNSSEWQADDGDERTKVIELAHGTDTLGRRRRNVSLQHIIDGEDCDSVVQMKPSAESSGVSSAASTTATDEANDEDNSSCSSSMIESGGGDGGCALTAGHRPSNKSSSKYLPMVNYAAAANLPFDSHHRHCCCVVAAENISTSSSVLSASGSHLSSSTSTDGYDSALGGCCGCSLPSAASSSASVSGGNNTAVVTTTAAAAPSLTPQHSQLCHHHNNHHHHGRTMSCSTAELGRGGSGVAAAARNALAASRQRRRVDGNEIMEECGATAIMSATEKTSYLPSSGSTSFLSVPAQWDANSPTTSNTVTTSSITSATTVDETFSYASDSGDSCYSSMANGQLYPRAYSFSSDVAAANTAAHLRRSGGPTSTVAQSIQQETKPLSRQTTVRAALTLPSEQRSGGDGNDYPPQQISTESLNVGGCHSVPTAVIKMTTSESAATARLAEKDEEIQNINDDAADWNADDTVSVESRLQYHNALQRKMPRVIDPAMLQPRNNQEELRRRTFSLGNASWLTKRFRKLSFNNVARTASRHSASSKSGSENADSAESLRHFCEQQPQSHSRQPSMCSFASSSRHTRSDSIDSTNSSLHCHNKNAATAHGGTAAAVGVMSSSASASMLPLSCAAGGNRLLSDSFSKKYIERVMPHDHVELDFTSLASASSSTDFLASPSAEGVAVAAAPVDAALPNRTTAIPHSISLSNFSSSSSVHGRSTPSASARQLFCSGEPSTAMTTKASSSASLASCHSRPRSGADSGCVAEDAKSNKYAGDVYVDERRLRNSNNTAKAYRKSFKLQDVQCYISPTDRDKLNMLMSPRDAANLLKYGSAATVGGVTATKEGKSGGVLFETIDENRSTKSTSSRTSLEKSGQHQTQQRGTRKTQSARQPSSKKRVSGVSTEQASATTASSASSSDYVAVTCPSNRMCRELVEGG